LEPSQAVFIVYPIACIAGRFLKCAGVWIYLDNSNSWIEAKRKQMMDKKAAKEDPAVRIDFDKLEEIVAQGRRVEGKFLYGSGMI
jgi:hypothetical protein